MIEYSPLDRTVTADMYFDTLMRFRLASKEKRNRLLSEGVVLMHDNARFHTAKLTTSLLANFKLDVFPHPPYSPNLRPSDYNLFPGIKCKLGGVAISQELWNCSLRSPRLSPIWRKVGIQPVVMSIFENSTIDFNRNRS